MNRQDKDRLKKQRRAARSKARTQSIVGAKTQQVTSLLAGQNFAKTVVTTPRITQPVWELLQKGTPAIEIAVLVFHKHAKAAFMGLGFDPAIFDDQANYTSLCVATDTVEEALEKHPVLLKQFREYEPQASAGAVRFIAWRTGMQAIVFIANLKAAQEQPDEAPEAQPEPEPQGAA